VAGTTTVQDFVAPSLVFDFPSEDGCIPDNQSMPKSTHVGLGRKNLLYEFPKAMAKSAILFGKRAGNYHPARYLQSILHI